MPIGGAFLFTGNDDDPLFPGADLMSGISAQVIAALHLSVGGYLQRGRIASLYQKPTAGNEGKVAGVLVKCIQCRPDQGADSPEYPGNHYAGNGAAGWPVPAECCRRPKGYVPGARRKSRSSASVAATASAFDPHSNAISFSSGVARTFGAGRLFLIMFVCLGIKIMPSQKSAIELGRSGISRDKTVKLWGEMTEKNVCSGRKNETGKFLHSAGSFLSFHSPCA